MITAKVSLNLLYTEGELVDKEQLEQSIRNAVEAFVAKELRQPIELPLDKYTVKVKTVYQNGVQKRFEFPEGNK